ncbi:serine acetyltransferase [Mycobacterium kyorinense]|uniref:Serine acetyltransferase n=2 Tax=Mycobacterium kyorinense TaxID=487514 RepID=A0A1X1XVA5_9MYCO|nr:serine acetyltransferase [Mycobacterium kyorinense]ORW02719.1 serine acetyltransferase [Mycobacterium kyorinense]
MIKTRGDLRAYLAADMASYGLQRWRLRDRFLHRPAHFQRLLRRSEYWSNTARTPVGRVAVVWFKLRTRLVGERLGFMIPRNVFGPGLSIAQPGGIWVHYQARVGANCRLHQGVTIGEAKGRVPVIGDDVAIHPLAMIIGADVGNRVRVLARAVVTDSVPDDVEVAGVPARIVPARVAAIAAG